MLKPFFLFCSLIFGCAWTVAAQKLELSVEGGLQQSWLPNHTERAQLQPCPPTSGYCSFTSQADIAYSYTEKPAGYLKAHLSYSTTNRLQLYHNLGFSLLRFQPKVVIVTPPSAYNNEGSTPTGNPRGCYYTDSNGEQVPCGNSGLISMEQNKDIGKTALLYAMQEIGASYRLGNRWQVNGGVTVDYRLYSQVHAEEYKFTTEPGGWGNGSSFTIEEVKDRSGKGFNGALLGLHAGAAYSLTDKLSLSLGLQHSLTPVYNQEELMGKGHEQSRTNQLRLGVQYKLKSW